jgi:hypothetical protein
VRLVVTYIYKPELAKLISGFSEHLWIVTASSYSVITNSHTLQFTRACTKSSKSAVPSPVVAW